MSDGPVKTCAFGDLDAGLWGIVWAPGTGELAAHIDLGEQQIGVERLEGDGLEANWRLSGEGTDLVLSAVGEKADLSLGQYGLHEQVQLCAVEGRVGDVEFRCAGQRSVRSAVAADGVESLRELGAWFGEREGVAVAVARPSGARSHDEDAIGAVLFEDGRVASVAEPRVSSVYDAGGVPVRAGLELWLEEHDEPPGEEEHVAARQFPRRAAGEALGRRALLAAGPLALQAELFRWSLRGERGTGVYLIARSR